MSSKVPYKGPLPKKPRPPKGPPLKRGQESESDGHSELMRSVAKDIIKVRFKNSNTIGGVKKKFFSIMRKHGIKHGTRTKGAAGILISNFEWTMAHELFVSRVCSHLELMGIFEDLPKDLEAY